MKNKLGIAAACLSGVKEIDALDLIRDVGFESVFSEDNDPKTVLAIREKCDRLGLVCDSLHAPWRGINDIWLEGRRFRRSATSVSPLWSITPKKRRSNSPLRTSDGSGISRS